MCEEVVFSSPDGSKRYVLIDKPVWKFLFSHAQSDAHTTEAGGILLGHRAGNHIHIISATGPLPDDKRERLTFDRIDAGHQQAAYSAWTSSGGTVDYVGDWHTHPQTNPTPSQKDYLEWRKLMSKISKLHIFAIVGTSRNGIWLGCGTTSPSFYQLIKT